MLLLSNKNDLLKLQSEIGMFDLIETCTQERQNSKWQFALITNVTIFAALSKNTAFGCLDSVRLELLLRNPEVNCLLLNEHDVPYNDNLCLFRAISIHLFGSVDVEPHAMQL